jgi:hypothetical protein
VVATGFDALRGIAPDNSGNIFVSDLDLGLKKVTNALQDFGTVTVGTTSTQQSIAFEVLTAGTLGTPVVLTKGVTGLDFKLGTGSTCVGSLAANTACVVNVTFTPQYAGERYGAVELTNSSGAVIATSLMQGNGSGPQVTYSPGVITTVAGTGVAGFNGNQRGDPRGRQWPCDGWRGQSVLWGFIQLRSAQSDGGDGPHQYGGWHRRSGL